MGRDLDVQMFLDMNVDEEAQRLRITGLLLEYRGLFRRNRLYPGIAILTRLHEALSDILSKKDEFSQGFEKHLDAELSAGKPEWSTHLEHDALIERLLERVAWGLAGIGDILPEAIETCNFVDSQIAVEPVGVLPIWREEGYWLFEYGKKTFVRRYELSIFSSSTERYRVLKTILVGAFPFSSLPTPQSVKEKLIRQHRDLPNPATYATRTEIEFPMDETVLPVSKRKLMRTLAA